MDLRDCMVSTGRLFPTSLECVTQFDMMFCVAQSTLSRPSSCTALQYQVVLVELSPKFGASIFSPNSGANMTKPRTTKPGSVRKIVPPVIPSEPEKAEIEVHDGDHLYKEIRIDNTLHDANGKKVKLKKDAEVDVTIEANEKDTLPKDD